MTTHAVINAEGPADLALTPAAQLTDVLESTQFTYNESDAPPANGDLFDFNAGTADFFVTDDTSIGPGGPAGNSATDNPDQWANTHSNSTEYQHPATSSINFTDVSGNSSGLSPDIAGGDAYFTPSDYSFDVPAANPADVPDVFSFGKGGIPGGGGGGGSGGGSGGGHGHNGTTPADYTTNSGTGVDFHITYDSSAGSAPTEFSSVVNQVADFFAHSLSDATQHITINIAVGYGEVAGSKMIPGALGESATNLQDVSYSDLVSAYSPTGLSLGSSIPAGNLYVSYAQAKALDIAITDPQTVDGFVGFSSQKSIFDYNSADGISGNQYDFYGTAAHEISEVLGRILLVGTSLNNSPSYMAYDFFHFSSPGVQDFAGNGGYFSLDQGQTNLANFNNPLLHPGDAGDWALGGTVDSTYDACNAFGTPGQVAPITHTDMLALQAVGYDTHLALV